MPSVNSATLARFRPFFRFGAGATAAGAMKLWFDQSTKTTVAPLVAKNYLSAVSGLPTGNPQAHMDALGKRLRDDPTGLVADAEPLVRQIVETVNNRWGEDKANCVQTISGLTGEGRLAGAHSYLTVAAANPARQGVAAPSFRTLWTILSSFCSGSVPMPQKNLEDYVASCKEGDTAAAAQALRVDPQDASELGAQMYRDNREMKGGVQLTPHGVVTIEGHTVSRFDWGTIHLALARTTLQHTQDGAVLHCYVDTPHGRYLLQLGVGNHPVPLADNLNVELAGPVFRTMLLRGTATLDVLASRPEKPTDALLQFGPLYEEVNAVLPMSVRLNECIAQTLDWTFGAPVVEVRRVRGAVTWGAGVGPTARTPSPPVIFELPSSDEAADAAAAMGADAVAKELLLSTTVSDDSAAPAFMGSAAPLELPKSTPVVPGRVWPTTAPGDSDGPFSGGGDFPPTPSPPDSGSSTDPHQPDQPRRPDKPPEPDHHGPDDDGRDDGRDDGGEDAHGGDASSDGPPHDGPERR